MQGHAIPEIDNLGVKEISRGLMYVPRPDVNQLYDSMVRVANDRFAQRMEAWVVAEESRFELESVPSENMRRQIVRTALAQGYFSIWMIFFSDDVDMKNRLVSGFPGTAVECYDVNMLAHITPRPANGLGGSGKA